MNLYLRENKYVSARKWRQSIIRRVKQMLGNYCHGCQTPDNFLMTDDGSKPFLELVIPERRSPVLSKYGNNTITIYSHILKGTLPATMVILLCPDCKFKFSAKGALASGNKLESLDSGSQGGDQRKASS